jgi:UDP:flavonoid glycosyltransferase YjiC (YdhE family)
MENLRFAYGRLLEASTQADVLVSHPLAMALPLVAEKTGIPRIATVLSPMIFLSAHDPPVIPHAPRLHQLRFLGPAFYSVMFQAAKLLARSWGKELRELRKQIGLPPGHFFEMFDGQFSPLLNLAMFDPQLARSQPDWPANTQLCGSPIFDGEPADKAALDSLEQFLANGAPPIVFALGSSAVWIAGDFWDKAVTATQQLGSRAVLLTGPHTPPSLPETVRAYSYLPYSRVFPRASVVVHQAGIGTLAQALRAGRPQLIVPVAFDQPDNAHRACSLGLARDIPFRKVTAKRLKAELSLLLESERYADAAKRVAAELSHTDGAANAAQALIQCARERKSA